MPVPSANNARPWQFLIITDKAKIAAICRAHPYARFGVDADAVIIPFGKKEGYKWFDQDMATATENLLLPAASLGLGATWCGLIDDRKASVHSVAGLPNAVFGFALVPIGIPAEGQPPRTESVGILEISDDDCFYSDRLADKWTLFTAALNIVDLGYRDRAGARHGLMLLRQVTSNSANAAANATMTILFNALPAVGE